MTSKWIRDASLIFGRAARHSLRDPAFAYALPTVLPLALVVIVSQVFSASVRLPGYGVHHLIEFIAPGIVFVAAMMGGGFTATLVVTDAASGYLDRLRMLPVSNSAILAGSLAFEAARVVPISLILISASAALGAHSGSFLAIAVVLVLAMAWSAAWNGVFLVAALRTRSTEAVQALVPLFLPFMMTSSLFVPRGLMPAYIQAIARRNPLDVLIDAVRPLVLHGTIGAGRIAVATTTIAGILALTWVIGAHLFTAMTTAD